MKKIFRVSIINPKGEVIASSIEDETNAVIHCAEFPKEWKAAGWSIKKQEVKARCENGK